LKTCFMENKVSKINPLHPSLRMLYVSAFLRKNFLFAEASWHCVVSKTLWMNSKNWFNICLYINYKLFDFYKTHCLSQFPSKTIIIVKEIFSKLDISWLVDVKKTNICWRFTLFNQC
jgi:hypothetical protein